MYYYMRDRQRRRQRNRRRNLELISKYPRAVASLGLALGVMLMMMWLAGAGIVGLLCGLGSIVPCVVLFALGQSQRRQ